MVHFPAISTCSHGASADVTFAGNLGAGKFTRITILPNCVQTSVITIRQQPLTKTRRYFEAEIEYIERCCSYLETSSAREPSPSAPSNSRRACALQEGNNVVLHIRGLTTRHLEPDGGGACNCEDVECREECRKINDGEVE